MYVDKRKLRCDNLTHVFYVLKITGLLYYRYVYLLKVCIYEIKNGRIFRLIKKNTKIKNICQRKMSAGAPQTTI